MGAHLRSVRSEYFPGEMELILIIFQRVFFRSRCSLQPLIAFLIAFLCKQFRASKIFIHNLISKSSDSYSLFHPSN